VEGLDRIMSRAVSPTISEFFSAAHGRRGVRILTSRRVTRLHGTERVTAVELADGEVLPADLVVVGIGVLPNTALADDAHIETGDGIVVDEHLQTSDPAISAVGDCARFPCSVTGANIRLESIQNATDHARTVAARLTGDRRAHVAIPWFWTEQYGHRLQIAGATTGDELSSVVRQVSGDEGFSVGRFAGHRLVSLESVDQPADHMAARKLLLSGAEVTPRQVADTSTPLKALLESEPAI
jgi:3-phenylpropionate/trans-cinnamate dioxygenase ferredoxin reductase component